MVGDPQSQADSQLERSPNEPLATRASKWESANKEVCTPNPLQCSDYRASESDQYKCMMRKGNDAEVIWSARPKV